MWSSYAGIALLAGLPTQSADAQDAVRCAAIIEAVDGDGRRISVTVEPVGSPPVRLTARGGATCVETATAVVARFMVTADGFQPHATAPIALQPRAGQTIVVTLDRPFAEELTVIGRAASLLGVADSASSGVVGAEDLASRPILKASDLVEAVPGVAMTEHSSGGHAPIILLRGYNLDHGTDFASSLEGAPLNLPSHAHAQGYTDLGFLIEELVGRMEFQKGPYSARVGNFGTAGSVNIELVDAVPAPFMRIEGGAQGFGRLMAAVSTTRGTRHWLLAGEASHDDGPSDVPDDFRRFKGVARYASATSSARHSLTVSSYSASWSATDGYPQRALDRGYLSRFGTLDASDGGRTQQHLLVASRRAVSGRTTLDTGGFLRYYDLDLFSNLTFWTASGADGDQIWQADRRVSSGGHAVMVRTLPSATGSYDIAAGLQVRHDAARVRLHNTRSRSPVDKTGQDGRTLPASVFDHRIAETSVSPFFELRMQPARWFRLTAGMRGDGFRLRVASDRAANSGIRRAGLASPKLSAAFGPWRTLEIYANAGTGFHTNHAAGVTQRVDYVTGDARHVDGTPVTGTPPVVRTRGGEVGLRAQAGPRVQSSIAFWVIDSDSELLYTPEDGVTSPERPGRRRGIEWLNFVQVRPGVTIDVDAAWSTARYRIDPYAEGRTIPDTARAVIGGGVNVAFSRVGASLRGRYVGRRPLAPAGDLFIASSFVVNGQAEVRVSRRVRVAIEAFNLLDRRYADTAYYFATRLRDPQTGTLEATAVMDYVTHPARPRTLRAGVRLGL